MNERELRAVAEAIYSCLGNPPTDGGMSVEYYAAARKAIPASDSQYVKGLVEALKVLQDMSDVSFVNDQEYNYQQQIIRTALQNLPEDLR